VGSERDRSQWEVVIVEDEEEIRDVLRLLLELDDRFRVVAEASDGLAGIDAVAAHRPAVVVVDMDLPKAAGPDVIRAARRSSPATRIVVFSCFPDPFTLLDVLRLGADSYLDKATAWVDLVPTLAELCAAEESADA